MDDEERPSKIRKIERAEDASLQLQPSISADTSNTRPAPEDALVHDGSRDLLKQEPSKGGDVNGETTSATAKLSKNQLKKLKKRQIWEAQQPERKAKRKEQRKRKKARERSKRAEEDEATRSQRISRKDGQLLPITVVFDCDYDDLMNEKEVVSLCSQLTRCYSENRTSPFKARLAISSFGGRLRERFDTVLEGAYKSWAGVTFSEADFVSVTQDGTVQMASMGADSLQGAFQDAGVSSNSDGKAGSGEVIYLSSDSDITLTELKPYSTYIIGGLVDRNRYKGRCYKSAMDKGVKTARLPIGQYLEMSSRHILTTNHVLEIMLKWLETGDWGAAFTEVIPKRKGGVLKSETVASSAEKPECAIEVSDEGEGDASSDGGDRNSVENE